MKTNGFSLIELMIVLVIISILATMAIPSYEHYVTKSRFSEVIVATNPYKISVSLGIQEGEKMSALNSGSFGIATFNTPTANLADLIVKHGVITATGTDKAGGYTYILTPDQNGSTWSVSGTCVAAGMCDA
ncbi:MAG: prepilin-type N-terminal cleavage/methylation domain-containing protein [Gammaproteobacteria bacterium]